MNERRRAGTEQVDVTVIIPTLERPGQLQACLGSIMNQAILPKEVVVVDTSEQPTAIDVAAWQGQLSSLGCKLVWVHAPRKGTASARNLALRYATGAVVSFVDDDGIVAPDYFRTVWSLFENDREGKIAAVAAMGTYIPPSPWAPSTRERLRKSARRAVKSIFLLDSLQSGRVLPSGFRTEFSYREGDKVQCAPVGSLNVRRSKIPADGFDEALEIIPYALSEDVDFSLKVSRLGWIVVTTKTAVWYHYFSQGPSRVSPDLLNFVLARNHARISRVHFPGWRGSICYRWAMLGVVIGLLISLVLRPTRRGYLALVGIAKGLSHGPRGSLG